MVDIISFKEEQKLTEIINEIFDDRHMTIESLEKRATTILTRYSKDSRRHQDVLDPVRLIHYVEKEAKKQSLNYIDVVIKEREEASGLRLRAMVPGSIAGVISGLVCFAATDNWQYLKNGTSLVKELIESGNLSQLGSYPNWLFAIAGGALLAGGFGYGLIHYYLSRKKSRGKYKEKKDKIKKQVLRAYGKLLND